MEPILTKLGHASMRVQAAHELPVHAAPSADARTLLGKGSCRVVVEPELEIGGVFLIFHGGELWTCADHGKDSRMVAPGWVPGNDASGSHARAERTDTILVHGLTLDMFNSLLQEAAGVERDSSGLWGAIEGMLQNKVPRRITCAGHGAGGALATVAALWAALKAPTCDVRCVTFGAPPVGNAAFADAFEHATGVSYRAVHARDPVPRCLGPEFAHVPNPLWLRDGAVTLQEAAAGGDDLGDHALSRYVAAIAQTQHSLQQASARPSAVAPAKRAPSGAEQQAETDKQQVAVDLADAADAVFATPDDDVEHEAAVSPPQRGIEALILEGKVVQAAEYTIAAYLKDGEDQFAAATGLGNAVLVHDRGSDAEAYVAWLPGGTAVLAFRGTEKNARDWGSNFASSGRRVAWLDAAFAAGGGLGRSIDGIEVHTGFLRQFESITSDADASKHLGKVLARLSDGAAPTRFVCCGHSLGGALATIAAAWAALEYPRADVRCITLGAPRVGNAAFVRSVEYLVGTTHRVVHGWDPVPSVPRWFQHVPGEIYIQKGVAALRERIGREDWWVHVLNPYRWMHHDAGLYRGQIGEAIERKINKEEVGIVRDAATGELVAAGAAYADVSAAAQGGADARVRVSVAQGNK